MVLMKRLSWVLVLVGLVACGQGNQGDGADAESGGMMDAATDAVESAGGMMDEAVQDASEMAGDMVDEAKEMGGDIAEGAQEMGADMVEQAKEEADDLMDEAKQAVEESEELQGAMDALKE